MAVFDSEDSQTVRSLIMTFGGFIALTAVLIGLTMAIA